MIIFTDVLFFACLGIHQVRILVFDNYQQCPLSLMYLLYRSSPTVSLYVLCRCHFLQQFVCLSVYFVFVQSLVHVCTFVYVFCFVKASRQKLLAYFWPCLLALSLQFILILSFILCITVQFCNLWKLNQCNFFY